MKALALTRMLQVVDGFRLLRVYWVTFHPFTISLPPWNSGHALTGMKETSNPSMTSPEGGILHETRMLVEDSIVACTLLDAPGTVEHKSEDNDCLFNVTCAIESVGSIT